MINRVIKQLNELAELLILLYEKLEIIEKSRFHGDTDQRQISRRQS